MTFVGTGMADTLTAFVVSRISGAWLWVGLDSIPDVHR